MDRLGHIGYLLHRAHFKGEADPPRPVPRPGIDPLDLPLDDAGDDDGWRPSSPAEALAMLRAEINDPQ